MIERFSEFIVRNAKWVILFTIAWVSLSTYGMKFLEAQYGFKFWFKQNDPAILAYEQYVKDFGNDDAAVIVIRSPSGVFDPDTVALIEEFSEKLWKVSDVLRVESLATQQIIRGQGGDIIIEPMFDKKDAESLKLRAAQVSNDSNLINYLVSEDLTTTLIGAHFNPLYDQKGQYTQPIKEVRALIEEFKGRTDHEFHLTGSAATATVFRETSEKDISFLLPLVILLTMALLYYIFRSLALSTLIAGLFIVGIFATMGIAGWIGIHINTMTMCVPQILIAITLADSIHLVQGFVKLRAKGLDVRDAARQSFSENSVATFMTSVTTALGFISFSASDVTPIHDLGILASIGVMLAWFITMGILPAAFIYIPFKIRQSAEKKIKNNEAFILRYINWIERHRIAIMVSWAFVFIASLFISNLNEIDSDLMNYYSKEIPIRKANDFLRDRLGSSRNIEVVLDTGRTDGVKDTEFLKKVTALESWLYTMPEVKKVFSITDILADLNQAMEGRELSAEERMPASNESVAQQLFLYSMSLPVGMDLNYWTTLDYRKMRIRILWTVENSEEISAKINTIVNKAQDLGLNMSVGAKSALIPKMSHYMVETFNQANTRSLLLVLITMILLCRSWKLGALAMIPNAVPPVIGGAFMYFLDVKYNVGSVLVLSVVMGIAVDDTIHFMSHLREKLAEGKDFKQSIVEVLNQTGDALLITTAVLSIGFGVGIFGNFLPFKDFGMMTAISLFIALFGDLMLLPAMLLTPAIGNRVMKRKTT
jgi:hypothetical protein